MAATFIYAILNSIKEEVKIGYSTDPVKRLAQLQTGGTDRLELLCTFIGTCETEGKIHEELKEQRISGEWFVMSQKIVDVLSDYQTRTLTTKCGTSPIISRKELTKQYTQYINSSIRKRRKMPLKQLLKSYPNIKRSVIVKAIECHRDFKVVNCDNNNGTFIYFTAPITQ
jgi:hypothetical protein